MARDIYIETGDISSRLLSGTEINLKYASGRLRSISSSPGYFGSGGYTAIYPESLIAEICRLKRAVDAALQKTQQYAKILSGAPEEIAEIDSSYKGEITSWTERLGYHYDNSFIGKAMAPIEDWAVDVCNDAISGTKELFNAAVETVEYGIGVVKTKVDQFVSDIKESYEEHGFVYDLVEYGKCVVKGAVGIVEIVSGAVEIATGGGIPLGIISIISGIDALNNVAADVTYLNCDAYELVGTTNWLEDTLTESGAEIGEYFGNAELGADVGEWVYTGFKAVSFLDSADEMLKSFGKVNTLVTGTTGYSFCWGWTSFDDVLKDSSAKIAWEAIRGTGGAVGDAREFAATLN